VILGIAIGILVVAVAQAANDVEQAPVEQPMPISSLLEEPSAAADLDDHDLNMAAAEIVWTTVLSASERATICEFYLTPPVGLTPELIEAFAGPAGLSYDEADDVLSELLAEEC
jgi:hypothetical protein